MKILKSNIKLFVGIIIGVLLSCVSVYALTVSSKDVSYDNANSGSESSNVQGAVDELYEIVNSCKSELKVVEVYSGNSQADRVVDVKSIIPDKYSELTIDDFYVTSLAINVSGSGMPGSNGTLYPYALMNTYDATTGTLTLNRRGMVYNTSGHNVFMTYKVVAIYTE